MRVLSLFKPNIKKTKETNKQKKIIQVSAECRLTGLFVRYPAVVRPEMMLCRPRVSPVVI